MLHPYQELPNKNFWKTGVQLTNIFEADIYTKKFDIDRHDYIATAGSCFPQHVAIRLRKAGYNYLDVEKAPLGLPEDVKNKFGYQLYSARFGNIYTARQLLQLVKEAVSKEVRAEI